MPLGQTILSQSAESLRKIRNSARFALGNIGGKEARAQHVPVGMKDLGLVSLPYSQIPGLHYRGSARFNFLAAG